MKKTLALFLMLLPWTSFAATPDHFARNISIPVEKYSLANGLEVILSIDRSMPLVAFNLWYQVGSNNEVYRKSGLAHLFEHLMFEGSTHVGPDRHFQLIENAGGFDVNASTGFDRTNYYQTVPKNSLATVMSLESSRNSFLTIDQKKLDEQRAVVRREREQRYEAVPYGVAALKLWQSIFPKTHPLYGRVIGSHEDLTAATLKDVQGFYDRYYGPSNASLTLVGDFDKTEAQRMIEKYFGTLPKTPVVKQPILPKVVIDKQEIIRVQEDLGKLPMVRMHYVTPALFQAGDAELDVLAHILTGSEMGRLSNAITRKKPLAASTAAYQQSFGQFSIFTIDALLNPGVNENDVLKEIDEVLVGLVNQAPTQAEIDRARNAILTSNFFALQNLGGNSGRAELLQNYNRFAKNPDYIQQDLLRYQKLDEKALQLAATRYLPVGKGRKILFAIPALTHIVKKGN